MVLPSSGLPVLLTEEKEAVLMGSAILGAVAAGDNVSGVVCVVIGSAAMEGHSPIKLFFMVSFISSLFLETRYFV